MLIKALADRFQEGFRRAPSQDTILWFDASRDYLALLDSLAAVPLRRYDGSLLALRYRLIHRPPGEQTVVYLPLRQEDAEILRPFFATSDIFKDRL